MNTGSKRLKWNAVIGLLVVAMLPVVAPPTSVSAASIVVTTSLDVVADDGNCSLREAITAANSDAFVIGCGAGSGADTITFWADTTIALGSRLPLITSNITIDGAGRSVAIDGQSSRAIARVQSSGDLTLTGLNIIRGVQQGCDGGDTCGTVLNYGNLQVNESEFSGNQGGGFTNGIAITNRGGGTLAVNSSTFTNNQGVSTGAIWNASDGSGTLTVASITNSTFSSNTAGGAADIYNAFNASLTITNSTFSDGQGDSSIKNAGGANTVIRNSIISSRAGTPACVAPNGTFDVNATNFATDATCGAANVVVAADLDLQPLDFNGGPTRTIALGDLSEVKDLGDPAICAAPPVNNLDQRGETRPQGFGCDPGAFELEFVAPQPTFFSENFDSNTLGSNLEVRQGSPNTSGGTVVMPFAEGNIVGTLDTIYDQANFCAQVTVVSENGATDNRAYFGFGRGNTVAGDGSYPVAGAAVVLRKLGNWGSNNDINNLTIAVNEASGGGVTELLNQSGVGPGTGPYTLGLGKSGPNVTLFVNGEPYGFPVDTSSYIFDEARVFFSGRNVTFDDFSVTSGDCVPPFSFVNTSPGADWAVGANWSGGVVPGPGSSARIPAGTSVTVAAGPGQGVGDLTVAAGASITIDAAGSLAVSGTLTVDGDVVIDEGGRLTFDGPVDQDVFGNGTVSNAGTIEINTENPVSLDATLTLTSAPTSSIDSRTAGGSFIVQSDYAELGAINVAPGASVEFVAGLFTADPSALIDVEIAAGLAGRLNFRERVLPIFNGAELTTTLVGGYIPAGADSYDIAICTDDAGAIGGDCGFDFTLNVSDAVVTVLPDRITVSAREELVTDGSFETNGWVSTTGFESNNNTLWCNAAGGYFEQTIATVPGVEHTLTFDWNTYGYFGTQTSYLEVTVADGVGGPNAFSTSLSAAPPSGGFAFVDFVSESYSFTPTASTLVLRFAGTAAVVPGCTGFRWGSATNIDNVSLTRDPATPPTATNFTFDVVDDSGTPGETQVGVGAVPILDIPIESIVGANGATYESAPLGSIPLGSIPLGSIDLEASPLGSIPLGSIPLGSIDLEASPLGSIPLGSIPLGSIGGWGEVLVGTALEGKPLQTVTLDDVLDLNPLPSGVTGISLADVALEDSPLGSISLPAISLGDQNLLAIDSTLCAAISDSFNCSAEATDTLIELQIASAPLGSIPLGSIPLGSIPLGSIPLGSIPLGSIPLGSIPLGSIGLDAAALEHTPLGSIPLGSIGSDGTCALIDPTGVGCEYLSVTDSSTLLDYVIRLDAAGLTISDTPLGSIPLGSIPLGSIPLGSIDLETVEINGAPLGSIPLGSIGLNGTGLAGTPLGSIPLGSIDLNATPLGSIPLGSIPLGSIDSVVNCSLVDCEAASLAAAAATAGALEPGATLGQLGEYGETSLGDLSVYGTGIYGDLTLGELDNLLTMELLYGDSTLGQAGNDYGDMTFGQILVSTMLQSDFPWETLPLADLGLQEIAPTGTVSYTAAFDLTGDGSALPSEIRASIPDDFYVVPGSANLVTDGVPAPTADATIASPVPGEQELTFDLALDAGYSYQITFDAVPGFQTGTVTTDAQLTVGAPIVGPDTDSTTIAVTEYFTGNNDFGAATNVPSDTLVFSHTSTPRTSDYFQFEPGPTGTRHVVFVSQFDVDTDIVLYKPATEQVSEVDPRIIPLGSTPIGDDGVDYGGDDTQEPALQGDFDIQSAPIGSVSINRGTTAETVESTISSAPISADDPYVIQVSGYQGNASESPYVVRVKKEQLVTAPICPATGFTHGPTSGVNISELPLGLNTVFLFNEERTAQQYGETEATAIRASLDALVANGANGVVGAVIPVESDPAVQAAYTAWDASPCDTDKANDVVGGITDLLAQIRTEHPTLGYVTIVGNDDMVPFARLDDLTSIANEGTFTEQFTDGALLGALATRHYLSDDPYGDIDPVQWLDRQLHMPELALGRLVENPSEIIGALDNFVEFEGRLDPQTAAVAGYDFLDDGTTVIFDRLTRIYGTGFVESLIDLTGTEATSTWTLDDLLEFLDLSDADPGSDTADIITVNAHSDQYRQLPSFGDASKDESDLFSVDDLGPLPVDSLLGNIVFTMGCHAGLSVSDIGVSTANSADWAQAYSEQGALYIANSGYGYGDTVSVALSERLMAEFAENLDGATTVGQAMAFAKQEYFAQLGQYGPYDEKVMQQVIFYGLPMYSVGTTPPPEPPEPLPTALYPSLGLQAASIGITPVYDSTTTEGIGTYLSIDGQTQNTQFRPIQPLQTIDISQDPTELLAHGAIITEATTSDVGGFDPVYFRPNVTGSAQVEPEAPSDEMATEIFDLNIATYNGPGVGPDGEPFVQQQQATLIAGSFQSPADGSQLGVQRTIDDAEVVVVYADPSSTDFEAPYISSVDSVLVSNQVSFTATTDATDIAAAIVLYRQNSDGGTSNWVSTPLVPDATGRTFSGGGPVDPSAIVGDGDGVDYKLWLVDTSGNVSSSDSKNVLWQAIAPPPPVVPDALTLTVPTPPAIGWYTDDVVIPFVGVAGVTYTVLDAGEPAQTIVGSGDITVTGDGVHEIIVEGGGLTARLTVLIDTSSPEVDSTSITDDELIEQNSVQTFEYECVDAGAGIAADGCTAEIGVSPLTPGTGSTIEPGGVIDTSVANVNYDVIITAIDELGNETNSTVTFSIEEAPPEDFLPEIVLIDAPTTPQLITDGVFIDVEFDDGNGAQDDYEVTIDWGNVDETEAIDSADTCTATSSTPTTGATSCEIVAEPTGTGTGDGVFTAQFQYPLPGVYPITVTITDSAGNVESVTTDEFVVVYDPEAGRVSGAGIYWSGPEAYTDGPSWGSPAFFGYNARYKGTNPEPRGKTKVRLFGEFFFKSTGYDYLIINDTLAVAEGVGKLDGQAGYRFRVQGVDNGWADFFQIEIWNDATGDKVYDNGVLYDSSTDVLLGGIRVKSR